MAVSTDGSSADAVVTRIVDGDTLDVRIGGRDERVRLLNVDTPESVDPDQPVQCLGPEATAFLEALLPAGTPVRLEYDAARTDRYDRTLAGVFTADGALVNAEIARAGLAAVVVFDDNVRFLPPVEQARAEAQAAEVGLFSPDTACTVPALVAQLDSTVVDHPVITPPDGAPAAEFVAAAAAPGVVVDAAAALARLLTAADQPSVAAIPEADRAVLVDAVEEIGRTARAERATLQGRAGEIVRAEAARLAEEARRAEEARAAEEARRAEEARAAEEARTEQAEQERAEPEPAPERRADPAPPGNPYPGYTGPRCYEPGGRVWHSCPS